jgi:hypothetical protein
VLDLDTIVPATAPLNGVKAIVLEKVRNSAGTQLQVGAVFQYTYKTANEWTARGRANKILEFEHKGEDIENDWKRIA